jgi:Secretion system C-terminal sorting domain
MKYRIQIYVIGFLFCLTMKEICFLIFSFLGICAVKAQVTGSSTPDSAANASSKKIMAGSGIKETVWVKLYPNPAKNKAELEIRGFEPGMVQVQIMSLNGTMQRNDQRLLATGNENLVLMFSLPAGAYFVVLRQKEKLVKKKLLVQ